MDSDSEKYINSALLCTKETQKSVKEKLKLIEYLLFKYKDHAQLLSKLKILTTSQKIECSYNKKLYTRNKIIDEIVINILAYLEYKKIHLPDDIMRLLAKDSKEYKNIVNWFFYTAECKMSDRIIRKLIENITTEHCIETEQLEEDCCRKKEKLNDSKTDVRLKRDERISSNIIDYADEKEKNHTDDTNLIDINTVDICVLEAFDAQMQRHLIMNKVNRQYDQMLTNRTISIIKTIIAKNKTRDIKLYFRLHINNLVDKDLTKIYFKNLRTNDWKRFSKKFLKYLKRDASLTGYINNVVKTCENNGLPFDWNPVFKIFAKKAEYMDFDKICCDKVSCKDLYASLENAVEIQRYKTFVRKVINTDFDTKLLKKYSKAFSKKNEYHFIAQLMNDRIKKLKKINKTN